MIKIAIDPTLLRYLGTAGGGALGGFALASLLNSIGRYSKGRGMPGNPAAVVPSTRMVQPLFVNDDEAKRLEAQGIKTHSPDFVSHLDDLNLAKTATGEENAGVGGWLSDSVGTAGKWALPAAVGLGAGYAGFVGGDKLYDNIRKQKARDAYLQKRQRLNALIAQIGGGIQKTAACHVENRTDHHFMMVALRKIAMLKTAEPSMFEKMMGAIGPAVIGAPFLLGAVSAFPGARRETEENNPNRDKIKELEDFYREQPDTPHLRLVPVRKQKKPMNLPSSAPASSAPYAEPQDMDRNDFLPVQGTLHQKTAGDIFRRFGGNIKNLGANAGRTVAEAITKPGWKNDLFSLGTGAAAYPAASALAQSIDDPTYRGAEKVLLPAGIAMAANRRLTFKRPEDFKRDFYTTAGIEGGGFMGLRGADAVARVAKGMGQQADAARDAAKSTSEGIKTQTEAVQHGTEQTNDMLSKALKYGGLTAGGIGAAMLLNNWLSHRAEMKEATRARRGQSRSLRNILRTLAPQHPDAVEPPEEHGVEPDPGVIPAAAAAAASRAA